MPRDSNSIHVPWSRHLNDPTDNTSEQNSQHVNGGNYKKRQSSWESRRKAFSEFDLRNGGNQNVGINEDSWDSQSDPGSNSLNNSSPETAKYRHDDNGGESDWKCSGNKRIGKKQKIPIQGRSGRGCRFRGSKQNTARVEDAGIEGNADFIVEIPANVVPDEGLILGNQTPQYALPYFDFMYYSCLTPHKWYTKEQEEETRCQYALSIIQKICCYYIAFMASFISITAIKLEVVNFVDDRTLNQFIEIGYFLVSGAVHWYLTYFVFFQFKTISNTFKSWDDHERETIGKHNVSFIKRRSKWLPNLNWIITVSMAIIKTLTYTELENWSFEGLILDHSKFVSYGIFIWVPDHLYDETLAERFGTTLNATTYIMGVFGVWNLQIDCFKDLLIWIATTNKHHMLRFGRKIKESLLNKQRSGKNSAENDEECWKAYREIMGLNNSTNACYGNMLIVNHLECFLVFSYWLTEILNKDASIRRLVFLGYNVIKSLLPYLSARISAKENEHCRKWLQSLPCETKRFRVNDTPYTREIMLAELHKEPMGLGRGKLHINNEFLVSLITYVISLFCFLFNIKPKEGEETLVY